MILNRLFKKKFGLHIQMIIYRIKEISDCLRWGFLGGL
jgi:hypothetical protein